MKIKLKKQLRPLMKHQEDAVEYLVRQQTLRKTGGALFMEMRLGKTLSMIRFLGRPENRHRKIAVLAPLVVCKSWANELEREGENFVSLAGLSKSKKMKLAEDFRNGKHRWLIVSYESAKNIGIGLHSTLRKDDVVIADESIILANASNQISKYLTSEKLFPQPFKYALCGEPAPEGKMQYVNQMMFCVGHFMGFKSVWSYRSRNWEQLGYEWWPKYGHDEKMMNFVHDRAFFLTRKQAGIGSKKIYEQISIPMTSEQKKAYNSMLHDFEVDGVSTNFITVQLIHLCRIAGGQIPQGKPEELDEEDEVVQEVGWYTTKKFEEIIKLLKGDLRGQKAILWFRFRNELQKMKDMMKSAGLTKMVEVHGGISTQDREVARLEFMEGDALFSLMTISTSKRGSDWSAASAAIYFSNEYSGDARAQSEDRGIHPMKTEPFLIIDAVTEGSVDEDVITKLTDKKISSHLFKSRLLLEIKSRRQG